MRADNLLNILGIAAKEDIHTNLFAYCIENSPTFRKLFFQSVLNWPPDTQLRSVRTRLSLPEAGVPDLILAATSCNRDRLGIVELKLHAQEGMDQTKRYASEDCLNDIRKTLKLRNSRNDLVFLTLYPDDCPENENFRPKCLSQLLAAVKRAPIADNPTVCRLLRDWGECLSEFYNAGTLKDKDILLDKLSPVEQLGSGYLAFVEFFRSIRKKNLDASEPWRDNPQGRPFYGIKFSRQSWSREQLPKRRNGEYDWAHFDAARHFDIHIELHFQRGKGALNLLVHYETNPYQRNLERIISSRKFKVHLARRAKFKNILVRELPQGFEPAPDNAVNQIARMELQLAGATVGDARRRITDLIAKTTLAINPSIRRLSRG